MKHDVGYAFRLAVLAAYLIMVVLATVLAPAARAAPSSPQTVIRQVFGAYGEQAVRVSWCESRWQTSARNGQYLGLFQMSRTARARYGHGPGAAAQSRAAYRYFMDSGRDWSPWTCAA